jgi:hypothetical protein
MKEKSPVTANPNTLENYRAGLHAALEGHR